jgi:ferredoxin-NAD(P)+ reductase (naphthalene dioxygenase ferredoxin-specific)
MPYTVKIRDRDETLSVETGQTILEAALAAGLPYPHGCRSGNCGACKSELVSGDIEMAPWSEYALSPGEKEQGLILACRAVPWSDAEIAWLDADDSVVHPIRQLSCTVAEIEQATHDIRRIRLEINSGGPFDFSAGQYASITFADMPPRDYSMANTPGSDLLEFHIRLTPGGAVSPFVQEQLKPGDHVAVEGPFGTAYWRTRHRGPVLAAAGGSGLAPVASIVETALSRGMDRPLHLYFGARSEQDVYLERELAALAEHHPDFRYTIVLSETNSQPNRRQGHLANAIKEDIQAGNGLARLEDWKAYIAGPPIMVETVTEVLKEHGLKRQHCHADAFYTEAEKSKMNGG